MPPGRAGNFARVLAGGQAAVDLGVNHRVAGADVNLPAPSPPHCGQHVAHDGRVNAGALELKRGIMQDVSGHVGHSQVLARRLMRGLSAAAFSSRRWSALMTSLLASSVAHQAGGLSQRTRSPPR